MATKEEKLTELFERLGHHFQDQQLLKKALTHRSIPENNNERLEFLGDSILSLIIASELYVRHPESPEGDLSRLRAILVNGEILAKLAKELNISPYLRLGAGESRSGGRQRSSILADALEALIGAIYLDAGMEVCRRCVLSWYGKQFEDLSSLKAHKDPKSSLQEWVQARKLPLPEYVMKTTGAAHAQTFHVKCHVAGLPFVSEGVSTSRRKAEQEAAERYLRLVNE